MITFHLWLPHCHIVFFPCLIHPLPCLFCSLQAFRVQVYVVFECIKVP